MSVKSYKEITSRYLKVQKKRTILTIIGIILSVALITAIGTMLISMREMMIKDEIKNGAGDYHGIFMDTPGDKVNNIKNHAGVQNSGIVSKIGTAALHRISEEEREQNPNSPPYRYVRIGGYDKDIFDILPVTLKEGRFPQKKDEIAIEYWLLDYMPEGIKVGDVITFAMGTRKDELGEEMPEYSWSGSETFEKKGIKQYKLVGLINPKSAWIGDYLSTGITFVDNNNLAYDQEYDIYVKMDSVKNVHKRMEEIAENVGLEKRKQYDDELRYPIKYNESLLRLSAQSLSRNLNKTLVSIVLFIIILIIVSTIAVIYNAFHISVLERISQFGMLRCIGASPSQIRDIVFKEAWTLSIIGIPIGLSCGVFAMKAVMYFIGFLKFEPFSELVVVISPIVFTVSAFIGLVTVFLSALGPAKLAGRIPALEAVRNTGSFKKESFDKIKKSRLSGLFLGIEGEIAYKNLRRNRKRFRITVFSMVISIILYIVFSSFVGFAFKVTAGDMVEMGDFVIGSSNSDNKKDNAVYSEVKSLPGVVKVFYSTVKGAMILTPEDKMNPKYTQMLSYDLDRTEQGDIKLYNCNLYAYEEENFNTFKPLLKQGKVDIEALNRENGVLIVQTGRIYNGKSNKTAIIDVVNYKVGDEIKVTTDYRSDNPKYKKVKVVGILEKGILGGEYNETRGINIITTKKVYKNIAGKKVYKNIAGKSGNIRFNIFTKEDADKEPIREYLKGLKEKNIHYSYTDRAERAKEDRNTVITISIFLYGFVAVITLIGCLNIINTISTNLILRTKELSMLKAVGMTENGIKKMVSIEGIFYGIIAAIYGGILGAGLSYLLYRMMQVQEFEWVMPWKNIIISMIGTILIALLSGYIPLRKINHGNIIDNIRMED